MYLVIVVYLYFPDYFLFKLISIRTHVYICIRRNFAVVFTKQFAYTVLFEIRKITNKQTSKFVIGS